MWNLFKKKDAQWMVGIDFGSNCLKAVALRGTPEHIRLEAMASVPLPKNSIVDHQLQDVEVVGEALKRLRLRLDTRISQVATVVTGSNVATKIILLPRGLSADDLENQVLLEAEQHIPFPLEEISLDYENLGPSRTRPDRDSILLSAARTDSISTRLAALNQAGWEAKVVDIGVHALARAAQALLQAQGVHTEVMALVDLGAECLSFAVLDQGEVIYGRLQNFGGAHFTRDLSQMNNIPEEQAERAKLDPAQAVPLREEVEQQHITDILQHIRRNLQLFSSSSGGQTPKALFLSGGGSQLPGLASILEQELGMPVLQPHFEHLLGEGQYANTAAYTTALGLALRSFTPCPE